MSASPILTPTTFSAGADNTLAAIDVYKQQGIDVINNSKNETGQSSPDLIAKIIKPAITPAAIKSMVSVSSTGSIKLNQSAIVNGIVKNNPALKSALSDLQQSLKDKITSSDMAATFKESVATAKNTISGGAKDLLASIKVTVGDITSKITSSSLSTVDSLASSVKAIAPDGTTLGKIQDQAALTTIGSNLVQASSDVGLNGVFTALAKDPAFGGKILNGVTSKISSYVAKSSNNTLVKEIIKAGQGNVLLGKQPSFVQNFLSSYVNKAGSPNVSLQKLQGNQTSLKLNFTDMQSNFNGLLASAANSANSAVTKAWMQTTRQASPSSTVVDASTVVTASSDAKNVISVGLNSQAPSFGSSVQQAVTTGQLPGLNTALSISQNAFSLAAMNQQPISVSQAIKSELASV